MSDTSSAIPEKFDPATKELVDNRLLLRRQLLVLISRIELFRDGR